MEQLEEIEKHKTDIYVLQQELETMIPPHTHQQSHILLVLDGVAHVDIKQHTYFIPHGCFVWIPEEMPHRISFDSKKIELLNIYFPKQASIPMFFQQEGVFSTPSLLYHTIELIKDQTAIYKVGDWHYELLITMRNILPNLLVNSKFPLRLPTSDHPIIKRILIIIHRDYAKNLNAQQVAQEVGMSVRTLSRYIRTELDLSLIQYIRTYRVVMAIKLLSKKKESISNIAYDVGYDSLTAFSNTFYEVTGYRPSQFLKLL